MVAGAGSSYLPPPDTQLPYQTTAMVRRLRTSKLMLTAYRAGLPVFTTKLNELLDRSAFFMPTMTRGRGSNPWGSTRIGAVIHLGDLLCSTHYVCPNIGKLSLTDELALFTNNTAGFRTVCRCFLFAGDSYQSILSELQEYRNLKPCRIIDYVPAWKQRELEMKSKPAPPMPQPSPAPVKQQPPEGEDRDKPISEPSLSSNRVHSLGIEEISEDAVRGE